MKYHMFSIYDSKAMSYQTPVFLRTAGEAIRHFETAANDPDSFIGRNPEDYTLFSFGTYDDETAEFVLQITPQAIARAIELKKSKE